MINIDEFVRGIHNFSQLSKTFQIDCFAYFLIKEVKQIGIGYKDIEKCFNDLNLPAYTNIPQYLSVNSQRSKRQMKYFIKNDKYYLTPFGMQQIQEYLGVIIPPLATDGLIPLELFQNTRPYLIEIIRQASIAYDLGLYDACSVMLRRVLETLIIETYEKNGILAKITDKNGEIYFLKKLIDVCIIETAFTLSRNPKQTLSKLKNLGDLSAHSRRYIAKKADVEKIKDEIRVLFQDLLNIIDYSHWKN